MNVYCVLITSVGSVGSSFFPISNQLGQVADFLASIIASSLGLASLGYFGTYSRAAQSNLSLMGHASPGIDTIGHVQGIGNDHRNMLRLRCTVCSLIMSYYFCLYLQLHLFLCN